MILGAGLGAPVADEYGRFGDTTDMRVLAQRLDEGLEALNLLWSGEPVTYRGSHGTIDDVVFLPTPVQRPRVPVWVGGPAGRDLAGPLADLGVTWWAERVPWSDDLGRAEPVLRRIEQGPPRI